MITITYEGDPWWSHGACINRDEVLIGVISARPAGKVVEVEVKLKLGLTSVIFHRFDGEPDPVDRMLSFVESFLRSREV